MSNIRIVYSNAADRAASIAASNSASSSLPASNMQNDYKGQVHRSSGTSVSYTLTWSSDETVGCVALPATNLSATATARVRLYSDAACTNLVADSGTLSAAPGSIFGTVDWKVALNANAFSFGGASKSAFWFATRPTVRGCVIDLVDTSNAVGYIDCSRLVIGDYWESSVQANYGMKVSVVDTTEVKRNDSGDLLPKAGTVHDTMKLELKMLPEADRQKVMRLMRAVGTRKSILVSVLPDNALSLLEQDSMIYGKRANDDITFDFYNSFSTGLSIEGW